MSDTTHTIFSAEDTEIFDTVVGHAIVDVDITASALTLDNGTVLYFEDGGDCCAWFEASLVRMSRTENIITDMRRTELPRISGTDDSVHWEICLIAGNEDIASVEVTGDATSGYYGSSINLRVFVPESAERADAVKAYDKLLPIEKAITHAVYAKVEDCPELEIRVHPDVAETISEPFGSEMIWKNMPMFKIPEDVDMIPVVGDSSITPDHAIVSVRSDMTEVWPEIAPSYVSI